MSLNRFQCGVVVALALTITTAAAQSRGLKILVIAGANAVNIIQQKTAVAPGVEVRDRNGLPVAGAVVKFAIKGGRASFKGARTVSVTTNAAGYAEASGLTPTSSGAVQITASAAFQGETAAVAIVQTNVMTAVQAAQIATSVGAEASGAAGGAGAGAATAGGASAIAGGGGLSTLAVAGIVGGAVAGGAIAAKQVLGGGDSGIYEGEFRIDVVSTTRDTRTDGTVSFSCTSNVSFTGEVRAEIDVRADGTVTGTVSADGFAAELSRTCPFSGATSEKLPFGSGPATGTSGSFQAICAPGDCSPNTVLFSGALNGGVITGTFTIAPGVFRNAPSADGTIREQSIPATSTQVTLTK